MFASSSGLSSSDDFQILARELVKEEVQESVKEEAKEEEIEEESDEEHDYVSMTKAELVELAEKRNLKPSGNKKKLIERLSKSD